MFNLLEGGSGTPECAECSKTDLTTPHQRESHRLDSPVTVSRAAAAYAHAAINQAGWSGWHTCWVVRHADASYPHACCSLVASRRAGVPGRRPGLRRLADFTRRGTDLRTGGCTGIA
jgi:hypothetical protein